MPVDVLTPTAAYDAAKESAPLSKADSQATASFDKSFESLGTLETVTADQGAIATDIPEIQGFRDLKTLDHGGMGIVFEGYDSLNRHVAVKMIRRTRVSERSLKRFQDEAEAMAHLEHKNIALILSHGVVDGAPFFVMKYFKGGSLAKRLPEYRKDPKRALELVAKMAGAVQFLHTNGHLHRDIKPQNILLDEKGEPFLADFGLVKRVGESEQPVSDAPPSTAVSTLVAAVETDKSKVAKGDTPTGQFLGTPGYASPEQARGDIREAGPHWDIWALGVVLYEVLTDKRPFPVKSPESYALLVNETDARPARELNPAIDKRINRLVMDCLQRDPAKRVKTAGEIEARIRAALEPGKRRPWLQAAAIGVIGLVIALAPWKSTPEEKADRDQAAASSVLERDGKVEIVDGDGRELVPLHFASPKDYSRKYYHLGHVHLESDAPCLVDCLKKIPVPNYGFQFDFLFNSSPNEGFCIGIYCDRQSAPISTGKIEQILVCYLSADRIDTKQPTQTFSVPVGHLFFPYLSDASMSTTTNVAPERIAGKQSIPAVTPGKWHTLRLAAKPDAFDFLLDDDLLHRLRRPYSENRIISLKKSAAWLHSGTYNPDALGRGCGIFLMQAGVQIRNVKYVHLQY